MAVNAEDAVGLVDWLFIDERASVPGERCRRCSGDRNNSDAGRSDAVRATMQGTHPETARVLPRVLTCKSMRRYRPSLVFFWRQRFACIQSFAR